MAYTHLFENNLAYGSFGIFDIITKSNPLTCRKTVSIRVMQLVEVNLKYLER